MALSITERASRYVARMDAAVSGSGGHDATFAVACALVHGFSLGESEAMAIMQEYNSRCSPPWSERELAYKLRSAANSHSSKGSGYLIGDSSGFRPQVSSFSAPIPKAEEVKFDPAALARAAGDFRPRLDWFAARSWVDPALVSSEEFLSLLFPGEKVLVFTDPRSQGQAVWPDEALPLSSADGMWFLSNPIDGISHPNPRTGKPSRRSEESVTRWKFALLESDEADPMLWLSALAQSSLPISAIYSSGGRSVHALIRVPGPGDGMARLSGPTSKSEWDTWARSMKAPLARLGADAKALTAVRLTRLPQQYRGEKLQKLLYVNPLPPFGERLVDLAPRRDALRDAVEAARAASMSEDAVAMSDAVERLRYYEPINPKFSKMIAELNRDITTLADLAAR